MSSTLEVWARSWGKSTPLQNPTQRSLCGVLLLRRVADSEATQATVGLCLCIFFSDAEGGGEEWHLQSSSFSDVAELEVKIGIFFLIFFRSRGGEAEPSFQVWQTQRPHFFPFPFFFAHMAYAGPWRSWWGRSFIAHNAEGFSVRRRIVRGISVLRLGNCRGRLAAEQQSI